MDKIDKFMRGNPRYNKFSKPLRAAKVCDVARALSQGRFEVISFSLGLLTLGVSSSSEAANLHAESAQIIDQVNEKLGEKMVERVRTKII